MSAFRACAVAALVLLPFAAFAWGGVRGDGHRATETRAAQGFTRIRIEAPIDATVSEGAFAVSLTLDENLMPLVKTEVKGDTLVVTAGDGIRPSRFAHLTVALPHLAGLAIAGSADAQVRVGGERADRDLGIDGSGDLDFDGGAGKLTLRISGSGDASLRGLADRLDVRVDGSGDVKADSLVATAADLAIEGSGDIAAKLAGGEASFRIDGSGDITWSGDAKVTRADVNGSGSIARR